MTNQIDGFTLGTYPDRSVKNRAIRAALNFFAVEACPYNTDISSKQWLSVVDRLTRAGKHALAGAVLTRVMHGRDRAYTKVVKLADGSLALAE